MFRLLFLAMIVLIISGCSSTKEQNLLKSYSKNIEYHKNLQQTQSATLRLGEESVASITATYMFRPTAEKNDTREEEFIVSVNFEDKNASMNFNQNAMFPSKDTGVESYTLTINTLKAIKVEALCYKDKRLKNHSFITPWSQYYKVTFPHIPSKMFNIKFANQKYGSIFLNFSKIAKFVYTKKGF